MASRERARTGLQVCLVLVTVLGSSWVVFQRTVYEVDGKGSRQPEGAVVVAVAGEVFRLSPGKGASALAVGQRLLPEDSVRTARGAHTDLVVGDRSRLTVAEGTQLTVRQLTGKVHRFKLSRGRIAVDYQADGGRVLRVESQGGAVAEAQAARFGMLSTGAAVAIAAETGTVRLSAHEHTVAVSAGTQAVALHGQPPSSAEPIARTLLLKIAAAPPAPIEAELCADVHGTAPAGAEVMVEGAAVGLAAGGAFHVRVPNASGRTSVRVVIRDAAGREVRRSIPCDKSAPAAPMEEAPMNLQEGVAIDWTGQPP